jgi:hypothetical protein
VKVSKRVRWTLEVEIVWWIETLFAAFAVFTPGMFGGLFFSALLMPVLVSHLRHGRTLGPIGYWYSVLAIDIQAAGAALSWTSTAGLNSARDWILAIAISGFFIVLGVRVWFAREFYPTDESTFA